MKEIIYFKSKFRKQAVLINYSLDYFELNGFWYIKYYGADAYDDSWEEISKNKYYNDKKLLILK